jgi:lysine biosynthesis protein LysW
MAETTPCTNPECGASIDVRGREVGDVVQCPKCGTSTRVPMDLGPGFDISTIMEPREGPPLSHPARQQCPNCNALLGVRVKICPECGMDIRTGAAVVRVARKESKAPLLLVIAGVAIVIAIVVLLVILLSGGEGG